MTSDRKIEANRRNSRKSCGPRTAAGKATASRNALRHGLAALTHRQPAPSDEVEEFARALCGGDRDPSLFVQAMKVAQAKMELRAIRAQKLAVIERLRQRHAAPFTSKDPTPKELKARILESRHAEVAIKNRLPGLVAKYQDKIQEALGRDLLASADCYVGIMKWFARRNFPEEDAIWVIFDAMSDGPAPIDNEALNRVRKQIDACHRDEHEVLKAAAPDLVRIDRYECRAWSRQKRAIQKFMMIKADARTVQCVAAVEKGNVCETRSPAGSGFGKTKPNGKKRTRIWAERSQRAS